MNKIFYYGIEMFSFLKRDNSLSNVDKVYGIVVDQSRQPIFYENYQFQIILMAGLMY